jgi:hypothetical protein
MSTSAGCTPASGDLMPGSSRTGRRLMYWSKPCRMRNSSWRSVT